MTSMVVLLVVGAIILIFILARLFVRSSRDVSLVRTGLGGRRVIMDGGGLAIPWFQEVARVNMQALKLEVARSGESSLITRDRMRVDIAAEFFVSVTPTEEGVSRAAQAFGDRTFNAQKLGELIEGRMVDALHSAAATMTLDELHEERNEFTEKVHSDLLEWFERNGLELESVSLTALDQTPFAALDENNAFNAEGMRHLAEVVANSRKERAGIDATADVSVRLSAMEANKRKFEIDLEEQQAEIEKVLQVETSRAAQLAEVSKRKADSELESARARIEMERQIRTSNIASDQAVQKAEIDRQRELEEARIATEQALKTAEINQQAEIELANQRRDISLAEHSKDHSQASAAADCARVEAVKSAEEITTVRSLAEAERDKAIALVQAEKEAEIQAKQVRAKALSKEVKSAAALKLMEARAAGKAAMIEAENSINPAASSLKLDLARLRVLPEIAEKMAKPIEKIESIKINQVSGLGSDNGEKTPLTQAMDSLLGMAVQLPMMKQLGKEVGIDFDEESLKEASRSISRQKGGNEKSK
ncbi:MAG: SPFH domain-containing protein [Gammaproteobacteria bacterium]|nr:SPFH domain-containing protein [Gammaproteobacteria bacterium]